MSTAKADVFERPFSWSYSKLKNYETCPFRHLHIDLLKDVQEEEGDTLKWGNRLHEAMARAIGNDLDDNAARPPKDRVHHRPLPKDLSAYQGWVEAIQDYRDKDRRVLVECSLAVDRDFNVAPWFGDSTWLRVRGDVVILDPGVKVAKLVDWKTGGRKPDSPQLALSALVLFAQYPSLLGVQAEYVWLGVDDPSVAHTPVDREVFHRRDTPDIWSDLAGRVRELEQAFAERHYPPVPGGLCRNYCPVHQCRHYKVGG